MSTGCNHNEFAKAVRFADVKRAGGPASRDGGTTDALKFVKSQVSGGTVGAGVVPGGQKKA